MYVKSKIVKNALISRKVLILESRKLVLLNAVTFNCVKMLLLSNNFKNNFFFKIFWSGPVIKIPFKKWCKINNQPLEV